MLHFASTVLYHIFDLVKQTLHQKTQEYPGCVFVVSLDLWFGVLRNTLVHEDWSSKLRTESDRGSRGSDFEVNLRPSLTMVRHVRIEYDRVWGFGVATESDHGSAGLELRVRVRVFRVLS